MRAFAGTVLFLVLLIGAAVVLWSMRAQPVIAGAVVWVGVFVALVVVEAALPYRRAWSAPDGQLANDFTHTLLGSALGSRLGGFVVDGAIALGAFVVARAAPAWSGGGELAWSTWPLAVQLVVAYVAVDFVRYWQHRVQHRVAFLWETHKLHHDARRLLAVKAGRSHILDRALQALCVLPVVVAGAPADVVFVCVALNSVVGLAAHANVDVKLGPLGWIVVGPRDHRVHHSIADVDQRKNFGASLIVWDRLFRSYRSVEVTDVGVAGEPSPRLLAQIAAPFEAWLR